MNNFQSQYTAVHARINEIAKAMSDEGIGNGGIGANEFVYEQLLAVNQDLLLLHQALSEFAENTNASLEQVATAIRTQR